MLAERTGLPLESCVFVDDTADNVTAARAAGLDGILFRRRRVAAAELRQRGLPV